MRVSTGRWSGWLVGALVLLAAGACSHERVPASGCGDAACGDVSPVPGRRTVCDGNAACGAGFICAAGVCVAAAPTVGDYRACALDLDCPFGDHCDLGACAHDCVADRDCPSDRTCDPRGRCATRTSDGVPPTQAPPAPVAPALAIDATPLDFTDFNQTKALSVRNIGSAPLAYRILGDKPWLTADPMTGTLAPNASTVVTVSVRSVGTGSRGTLSVVSSGGVASAAVTVPDRVAGLYQGEVAIAAPVDLGRRALALRLAQDESGGLQGVVDDARSPAFGYRAALEASSVVSGPHLTLAFTIPGKVGAEGSSSPSAQVARAVTLDGVVGAGGRLTGRYSETIRGGSAAPVILTGTFELLPVDRGVPLLPVQAKAPAPATPAAPNFLACDACPSGKCPSSHAAAGADFLRAAFKFFGTALEDGTHDAYAPIRACVDDPTGCYDPIALHCAQAHFYKALQERDPTTCPETGQVACAQRGLLDTFKGLLIWNGLVGNEHLVRAYALGRSLDEQMAELSAARDAFLHGFMGDSAGGAQVYGMLDPFFLGWLAGIPPSTWSGTQPSFFPEQLSLPGTQQTKLVPAFGDIDRLAAEMALWVQSVRDQLAARHRLDAEDGPDLVLQAGRDVAEAHLSLAAAGALLTATGGPEDRLARAVNGAAALTQAAARIGSGLNPAGYPDSYIAYTYPPTLGSASNNYLELAKDFSNNWLAAATAAYNTAQSSQRDFESTYQNLAREVTTLNADYGRRVADLCGGSARTPSLAGCGVSGGLVFDTAQQIKSAHLRLQNAAAALSNQYLSIQIEQNRAAQQVNLHEVTAFAITEDGRKLEALAGREAALDEMEAASSGFFGAVSSLASVPPNIGAAIGSIGAGITGGLVANARGEIEQERIRIDTLARARVEYDQGQAQLIDSAARVKTMLLELPTLRINALAAELDIARLLGLLRAQVQEAADTMAALDRQQKTSGSDPRRDPAFRQYRDLATTLAAKAFDAAQGQLFLVTRALEYETGMSFGRRAELFSFTTPAELASYLGDVEAAYQRFVATIGNRQQRETTLSLRDQIFRFPTPLVDPATGQVLSPAEVFHQLLADPRNRDAAGSLRLAFTLSLAPDALTFNGSLCTDTLTGMRISLVGAALGATQPEVVMQQRGSAYVRSCTELDQNGDYAISEYGLDSTVGSRRAIVQAGLNLSGPNDASSGGPVNTEFYGRPIAAPYELTIDRTVPANAGLDLAKLDDIVLFIQHESRTVR
jgi:hypothetical protein